MTKIELAKKTIHVVVTVGTGRIISQVIKNNTTQESVIDQVTMTAGSFVLGGLVAAETAKYTDRQVDEIVQWWKDNM